MVPGQLRIHSATIGMIGAWTACMRMGNCMGKMLASSAGWTMFKRGGPYLTRMPRALVCDRMNLNDFTEAQRQALLDLAMLAMYADGHLAAAEDERIQRLLTAMGFSTDYDRGKHFDASVSRVSRHSATAAAARAHAESLAKTFATREQRRRVHDI